LRFFFFVIRGWRERGQRDRYPPAAIASGITTGSGGCGAARGAASVTTPEYQSADHAEYESRDLLDLSVDYLR